MGGLMPSGPFDDGEVEDYQVTVEIGLQLLTVEKTGTGTGIVTSSPAGIDCGADCSELYDFGTVVTLLADPNPGFILVGWRGDAGCVSGIVTMDTHKTRTARFDLPYIFADGFESGDTSTWGEVIDD